MMGDEFWMRLARAAATGDFGESERFDPGDIVEYAPSDSEIDQSQARIAAIDGVATAEVVTGPDDAGKCVVRVGGVEQFVEEDILEAVDDG